MELENIRREYYENSDYDLDENEIDALLWETRKEIKRNFKEYKDVFADMEEILEDEGNEYHNGLVEIINKRFNLNEFKDEKFFDLI